MSEYELVKKSASQDNFKGLKSTAKEPRHKLFAQNKLSAPSVLCERRVLEGDATNSFLRPLTNKGRLKLSEASHLTL